MAEKTTIDIQINVNDSQATQSLDNVKKSTDKVTDSQKNLNKEQAQSLDNLGAFGITIGGVKSAFAKVIPTAKALFGSIKAGLISTGIGAFVVLIGSLISYLMNTKKGAELLEQGLAVVGATISVLTDRISAIGSAVVKFFKGDLKGATQDVKGAFKGIGEEIKNDIALTNQLTKASQRLRDEQRELNVQVATQRAEIEALKLVAEDVTKSEEERLSSAQKAFAIENKLMQEQIRIAEEKLNIKRQEVEMSESTAEDLDELAELEINVANIRQESTTKQIELNNKVNAIRQEQQRKYLENIRIRKEKEREVLEANLELAKKGKEIRNQIMLDGIKDERHRAIKELEIEFDKQERLIEKSKASEERKGIMLMDLMTKFRHDRQKINDEFDQKELDAEKQKESKREELRQKRLADAQALAQAEMELEKQVFNTIDTGLNLVKGALKEGSKAQRTVALIQLGVDTAKAISSLIAGSEVASAQFAVSTGPAAPFTYVATKIALYTTGLAQIMQNISQAKGILSQTPQFASGGMVGGYGSGTSDSVNARLSKGESVINAKSTAMFQPLLSAMNVAGGGVGFARGGVVGGNANQNLAQAVSNFTKPTKAFVVTDEMTNSQNQLAGIRRKATF